MSTKGYLFEDDREEWRPYVLFLEGLEGDEGEPDAGTVEVRFATLAEAVSSIVGIQEELGRFEMALGEPEHFEDARSEVEGGEA